MATAPGDRGRSRQGFTRVVTRRGQLAAQGPRLTSPCMASFPPADAGTLQAQGEATEGERAALGLRVGAGRPQRPRDALRCRGKATLTSLLVKTNLDVLEKNLQGAAAQEATGRRHPKQAASLPRPPRRGPPRLRGAVVPADPRGLLVVTTARLWGHRDRAHRQQAGPFTARSLGCLITLSVSLTAAPYGSERPAVPRPGSGLGQNIPGDCFSLFLQRGEGKLVPTVIL